MQNMQEAEVMIHMTNVAHAQQEIRQFLAEVTHSPVETQDDQETSAWRVRKKKYF